MKSKKIHILDPKVSKARRVLGRAVGRSTNSKNEKLRRKVLIFTRNMELSFLIPPKKPAIRRNYQR